MQFQLRLDERRADRVYVTVCLSPEAGDTVTVEGVAVELRCRSGQPLSARLMVPVRGPLSQPLQLGTELRSQDDLPRGARVVGIAWTDCGTRETSVPADPGTAMEAYARGARIGLAPNNPMEPPLDLTTAEHKALVRAFPWMAHFRVAEEYDSEVGVLDEQGDDLADDIADCYGLCDEDKDLLKELLGEDDGLDDHEEDELAAMLSELDEDGDGASSGARA